MKIKLYTIHKGLLPFFILLGSILAQPTHGQVTIGSESEPVPGALLQIKENAGITNNSTKGLNLPRVKLTSKTNLYPMFETNEGSGIANSYYNTPTLKAEKDTTHTGLMVYHMDQCTLSGMGVYIWDGNKWVKIGGNDSNSFESIVKVLRTTQDQIAPNGVAWHKDHEGNIFFSMNYDTTTPTANNNRWMITNLATKTYAPRTGGVAWTAPLLTNTYASNSSPYTAAYWGYPNEIGTTTANLTTAYDERPALGLLYNWAAATGNQNQAGATSQAGTLSTGVQGICPQGWHLPTDTEWTELITYIKANPSKYSTTSILGISDRFVFINQCESSGETTKGQSHPISEGGFSILLAGNASSNKAAGFGRSISFWSTNSASLNSAYSMSLFPFSSMNNSFTNSTSAKSLLYPVRCKKDK